MKIIRKKYISGLLTGMLFLALTGSFKTYCQTETKAKEKVAIPDSLSSIFKNSCMECHSNRGSFVAKAVLNFSEWNDYKL